jgi:hypothetical protein
MSACQCIKCEEIVPGFQKYCDVCVRRYGVAQNENSTTQTVAQPENDEHDTRRT